MAGNNTKSTKQYSGVKKSKHNAGQTKSNGSRPRPSKPLSKKPASQKQSSDRSRKVDPPCQHCQRNDRFADNHEDFECVFTTSAGRRAAKHRAKRREHEAEKDVQGSDAVRDDDEMAEAPDLLDDLLAALNK